MPLNELRTSGMLQAAIIAVVLAVWYRGAPATDPPALWPHILGGYGFLAATVPWLTGASGSDFNLRTSALLGVIFALPMAVSAWMLRTTPYPEISIGCWVLVAAWGLHVAVSLGRKLIRR